MRHVTQAITADPMKKAMVQMQGIFAELDKSLTVRKLRKAREKIRKETGKCEGRKSYRETEHGAAALKEIKRLRRKPKGGRVRKTYVEIAAILNEKGLYTASGKPFNANNVRVILHRHQGSSARKKRR